MLKLNLSVERYRTMKMDQRTLNALLVKSRLSPKDEDLNISEGQYSMLQSEVGMSFLF